MTDQTDPLAPASPALPVEDASASVVDEIAVDTDQIIGMAFDKTSRADEVLLNLSHLAREGEITLTDAVVVYKDDNERVHVRQTVDPTPKQGAMSGALWGLLIGSLFGPAGFLIGAGAGAASGGLMGKLVDVGLDDGWVKEVGNWIDPGTSALLVLVSEGVRPVVLRELSRFEGRVLYCTFPDAVRHELDRALSHAGSAPSGDEDPSAVIFDQPSV